MNVIAIECDSCKIHTHYEAIILSCGHVLCSSCWKIYNANDTCYVCTSSRYALDLTGVQ